MAKTGIGNQLESQQPDARITVLEEQISNLTERLEIMERLAVRIRAHLLDMSNDDRRA